MDAPEELVEAVAMAMAGVTEWNDYPAVALGYHRSQARIVLAVPAIADAFRDAELLAKVREVIGDGVFCHAQAEDAAYNIAYLLAKAP